MVMLNTQNLSHTKEYKDHNYYEFNVWNKQKKIKGINRWHP